MTNLTEALAEILVQVSEGMETGKEFLKQEIPDVVSQLLIWKMVHSFIFFLVGMVLVLTSIFVLRSIPLRRERARQDYEAGEAWTRYGGDPSSGVTSLRYDAIMSGSGSYGVASAVGFLGVLCLSNLTWLKILIAPKLYIIEYAANLIK